MQNLGYLGANGGRGQNSQSKMSCLESPTLICLFTMQLLWGYTMMIKGSLLLSKVEQPHCWGFQAQKSPCLGQILTILENK